MSERIITNPVTKERVRFIETSRESGGARTVAELEVGPGGGVPGHSHDEHEEWIEVLDGTIEVAIDGVTRRCSAGERIVIPPGSVHAWRNPTRDGLRFRGTMTPGHPGFETMLRVLFGLARDGEVRPGGLPKRFDDLGLLMEWNRGQPSGLLRLLAPLLGWSARRAKARGRAAELLRRYGCEEPPTAHAASNRAP